MRFVNQAEPVGVIEPVVLRRLQSAESGLSLLERQPDRLLVRQAEIERRAPLLMAEVERLLRQREQTQRQRQIVSARLEQVTAEVEQLSARHRVVAQRVFHHQVAPVVLGPGPLGRGLPDGQGE